MLLDGLEWLGTTIRMSRAAGGAAWWIKQSARERMDEAIALETARLLKGAEALRPPFPEGTLSRSMRRTASA